MIERQAEPPIDVGLNRVLPVAERPHVLPGLDGAEFGRRAVFIGAANEQNVVADLSPETGMDIGRQQRADEISDVLDAVHIGKGAGNENPGHDSGLSREGMPNPEANEKALPRETGRALDSAYAWRENARAIPSGRTCGRVGAFVSAMVRLQKTRRKSLENLRRIACRGKNARSG